jgi:large subunit ribosomal protein L22
LVRGKNVGDALVFLKFAPKKGADILYKLLYSAVKNAEHNDSQKASDLYVSTLSVTKGIVYKRGNPVSRGRTNAILKRTANIILELQVR